MHLLRHRQAMAVWALGILAASACGGGSHSAHSDVASKPPVAILNSARRAVLAAKSVHIAGGSPTESLDLRMLAGQGAVGDVTQGAEKFQVVRIGPTAYVKGNAATIQRLAGAKAAQKLGGRWLKLSITDPTYRPLKMLTQYSVLLGAALSPKGKTVTKLAQRTVRGIPAIGLQDQGGGILYIAATGQPYPVEIDGPHGQHDKIVFSEWNQPVALHPPANAISVGALKKQSG